MKRSSPEVIVPDLAAWCSITFDDIKSNPTYYSHHIYNIDGEEIKNLIIPSDVVSIGRYAFIGCTNLSSLTISEGVKSIEALAFNNCAFSSANIPNTVISREYSQEWKPGDEPYYPVNDNKNLELYKKYKELADLESKVIFGGRLAQYQYFDMDAVVSEAIKFFVSAHNMF